MAINPKEIRRQAFKKSFNGYDREEVRGFLEMVSNEIIELIDKKEGEGERISRLEFELDRYKTLEKTLQETLLKAQQSLELSKTHSEREADIVLKEAEIKAEEMKARAKKEVYALELDMNVLTDQKKAFIIKFRSLIKSQLEMLNILEFEPEDEKPLPPPPPPCRKKRIRRLSLYGNRAPAGRVAVLPPLHQP